ncbi:MAG: sulfatase [Rikenellaceae bacterium]
MNTAQLTFIAALPLSIGVSCASNADVQQPNILWVFGEDISPWMPIYGDSTVTTPNIDFLAANGVTYTNCYSTCSVSSPCRSGLVTGMMQTTIGMHNHRTGRTSQVIKSLPEGVQVLPQMMRKAGFHTFNSGKDDFNWQYEWSDYWTGEQFPEKRFFGKEGKGSWNDRAEGQPFFGEIELFGGKNHKKPKDPVDISRIKVPPYYPDCEFMRNQLAIHYNQIKLTDNEIGELIEQMKQDGIYENTIIIFLSDNGYQTLRDKQFLYDGGIHMPFIIAAPGNHKLLEKYGLKMGSINEEMISLLDVTATSLAMANIEIPENMESKNLLDKDYHRDWIVAARDRCDFTIDRIRCIRDLEFKYIRNFMTDRPLMQPQYRDKTAYYKEFMTIWKSGEYPFADEWLGDERPAEELYDIVNDPHEIHNLAKDPAYAAKLEQMRNRLDTWVKETDDQGQYPESKEQLTVIKERWGERAVNKEYDIVNQ